MKTLISAWKAHLLFWLQEPSQTELLMLPNTLLLSESGIFTGAGNPEGHALVKLERQMNRIGFIAYDTRDKEIGLAWHRKMDCKANYLPSSADKKELSRLYLPDWRPVLMRAVEKQYAGYPFKLYKIIASSGILWGEEPPTGLVLIAIKLHMRSMGFRMINSFDPDYPNCSGRWIACAGRDCVHPLLGVSPDWYPHIFKEPKPQKIKATAPKAKLTDFWKDEIIYFINLPTQRKGGSFTVKDLEIKTKMLHGRGALLLDDTYKIMAYLGEVGCTRIRGNRWIKKPATKNPTWKEIKKQISDKKIIDDLI